MSWLLNEGVYELLRRGGPVMWVLLALSFVSLTLIVERMIFWFRTHNSARLARVAQLTKLLRNGDRNGARAVAESDGSVYGRFALTLLDENVTEATAVHAVELHRPDIDRYMGFLSTIISAAPMLGLLGTVTGMILTFQFMSNQTTMNEQSIGLGLSEALLNTAAGLIVAITALFPYNAFRVQSNRALARFEAMIAAAVQSQASVKATAVPNEPRP